MNRGYMPSATNASKDNTNNYPGAARGYFPHEEVPLFDIDSPDETGEQVSHQISPSAFDPCRGEPPMASFIRTGDKLPAYIAYSMYGERPQSLYGYTLIHNSPRVAVYASSPYAIVGLRGTSVGAEGSSDDIFDDIEIAFGDGCQLSLNQEALPLIEDLTRQGFQVTLTGHSLGGRAALCLGRIPGVVNVVALNAGAPAINPEHADGVAGIHYHVVGDFISTHVYGVPTIRVRMRLDEKPDWLDPWFHSADRFLGNDEFVFVGPNNEQADLEEFLYKRGFFKAMAINAATSILGLSWYSKAKAVICETPIPGAQIHPLCMVNAKSGFNTVFQVLAGLVGAAIGILTGPAGAVAGYFIGAGLAEGDVSKVLDAIVPGFSSARDFARDVIIKIVQESTGPQDMVEKLQKYMADQAKE